LAALMSWLLFILGTAAVVDGVAALLSRSKAPMWLTTLKNRRPLRWIRPAPTTKEDLALYAVIELLLGTTVIAAALWSLS